jgi:hypothetical protein
VSCSVAAVAFWLTLRQRPHSLLQAGVLAAVGVRFLWSTFESLSLAVETRRRDGAERNAWEMCERRIYRDAVLFATTTTTTGAAAAAAATPVC